MTKAIEKVASLGEALTKFLHDSKRAGFIEDQSKALSEAKVREAIADSNAQVIASNVPLRIERQRRLAAIEATNAQLRQFQNHEAIEAEATRLLSAAPDSASRKSIDLDWFFEYREQSKNVGDPEMQFVWSRILAGEFASPGTFSFRTLDFVRKLRKDEAAVFTWMCEWSIRVEPDGFNVLVGLQALVHGGKWNDPKAREKLALMRELGLLSLEPVDKLRTPPPRTRGRDCVLRYYEYSHTQRYDEAGIALEPEAMFTRIGNELAPFAGGRMNEEFGDVTLTHAAQVGDPYLNTPKETRWRKP